VFSKTKPVRWLFLGFQPGACCAAKKCLLACLALNAGCGMLWTSLLNAQSLPSPPQTFSILEASDSLEPAPPESTTEASAVPPPDQGRFGEAPAAPEDVQRFDNLFLDFPNHEIPEPITPVELEELGVVGGIDDALAASALETVFMPTMATDLGYQVLLAGPVHEALLMRTELTHGSLEPVLVPQAPPEAIEEQPASTGDANSETFVPKFAGKDVQWISGYWFWLDAAHRYVWVSGLYRAVPPGREWIAGSWMESRGGYRWRSGYWAEASQGQLANQPHNLSATPPPALRVDSPTLPPPTANSFWIRGYWQLVHTGADSAPVDRAPPTSEATYTWQPGYWATHSPQWIWQPAHIAETEAGFLFVSGYWDFEPHFRGQAFACVVLDQTQASPISYQPRYPLSRPAATLLHLFVKEGQRHYFYGDYYHQRQLEHGYQAWYELGQSTLAASESSPLLSFYRWRYALAGIDLVASLQRFADHFRAGPSIRPAAQIADAPKLVEREGLAGQVNADSFDAIVRGNVGQQSVVKLAASAPPAVVSASATAVRPAASQARSTPAPRLPQRAPALRLRQRQ